MRARAVAERLAAAVWPNNFQAAAMNDGTEKRRKQHLAEYLTQCQWDR